MTPLPTCLHAFWKSLETHPHKLAIRIVEREGNVVELSYQELFRLSSCAVAGYRRNGLKSGDCIILALPTCKEFFGLYMGALFGGIIPLVEPAPRNDRGEESAEQRLRRRMERIGARVTVVSEATLTGALYLFGRHFLDPSTLLGAEDSEPMAPPADGYSVSHLQTTSGSTGEPRILAVQHRNIVANVSGIGAAIHAGPEDSLIFWLPMFHDMGLIAVLCSFYWGCAMTITDASNFPRNPVRFWWQMMSDYGATITAAPNSAYEVCARIAARRKFKALNLACCRVAFWGSEPIYPRTVNAFESAFREYGYPPNATFPVYGMAETTLAAALPQVHAPLTTADFDTRTIPGEAYGQHLDNVGIYSGVAVSVGQPLTGHRLRIVNPEGRIVSDDQLGEIELAGPSVIDYYWQQGRSAQRTRSGEFLRTGDVGFQRDGNLYVVARIKEIMIVNGSNFIPDDIENAAAEVAGIGIHKGVAAIGIVQPNSASERIHLVVECRVLPVPDQSILETRIQDRIATEFGVTGIIIRFVPKGGIPKTTSGKIQRFKCRQIFELSSAD